MKEIKSIKSHRTFTHIMFPQQYDSDINHITMMMMLKIMVLKTFVMIRGDAAVMML